MTQRVLEWCTARLAEGDVVAMATVIETSGSVPGKVGARLALTDSMIEGTVGGAGLELKVTNRLRELLSTGKVGGEVATFGLNKGAKGHEVVPLDSLCGGRVCLAMEVVMPMPHILLMGGGHVAQAIAHMCDGLGWDYSVQDTRSEFSSVEAFPDARERHNGKVANFLDSEDVDSLKRFSDILLLGHDWKEDEERFIGLLSKIQSSTRVGVIGSKSKWQAFSAKALENGISQSVLDSVDCPIGLDIGAESPAEIALAVVAAVLSRKKGADPTAGNWRTA
jgi:xanthine dehydrogenase accessory factor